METENQKDRTMAENTETKRSAFVERLPGLTNSKWGGISKEDGSKIVAAIFEQGSGAIKELISGLREVDSGEDWQERLLLHQLAVQSGAPSRANDRKVLIKIYASVALGDGPATIRSFLLQQLRYVGGATLAPELAPLLKDGEPLVLDAVAAVMVSIGKDARVILEEAKKDAQGHARVAITHALGQLSRR